MILLYTFKNIGRDKNYIIALWLPIPIDNFQSNLQHKFNQKIYF